MLFITSTFGRKGILSFLSFDQAFTITYILFLAALMGKSVRIDTRGE